MVTGPTDRPDRVTSPVTVTGTAEVFEATVSVRVLDAAGREIGTGVHHRQPAAPAAGATTGSPSATGWPRPGRGTVEVYEVSPRDGSRVNVVRSRSCSPPGDPPARSARNGSVFPSTATLVIFPCCFGAFAWGAGLILLSGLATLLLIKVRREHLSTANAVHLG